MIIGMLTLLCASVTLGTFSGYLYNGAGVFVATVILFMLATAVIYGAFVWDERLLLWAGALEMLFMLLPLLTFDANPGYLPYAVPVMLALLFPFLWTLMPIGLMHLIKTDNGRKIFFRILLGVTILVAICWLVAGQLFYVKAYDWDTGRVRFVYFDTWTYILTLSVLLVPLAMWAKEYRWLSKHLDRDDDAILIFVRKNLPEVLLVLSIVIIAIFGFLIKPMSYNNYYVCGDGMCDVYEDLYTCPYDCGYYSYCGDGYCDSWEYGSCDADCFNDQMDLGTTVIVSLSEQPGCVVRVDLFDHLSDLLIERQEGMKSEFTFTGVDTSYVSALATNVMSGVTVESPPVRVENAAAAQTIIDLELPEDFCSAPAPPFGPDDVVVLVFNQNCPELTVALRGENQELIASQTSSEDSFIFNGVESQMLYAEVSSPQSDKVQINSEAIDTASENTIVVSVPGDYCQASLPQTGGIRVTVVDTNTNAPITASVTLLDEGDVLRSTQEAAGEFTFVGLDAGYYYFTASALGYEYFYGKGNMALIEPSKTTSYTIRMVPLAR